MSAAISLRFACAGVLLLLALASAPSALSATVPAGFTESRVAPASASDGDGVRPGRPALRRRAGRQSLGHQERRAARRRRSSRVTVDPTRRARAARRRRSTRTSRPTASSTSTTRPRRRRSTTASAASPRTATSRSPAASRSSSTCTPLSSGARTTTAARSTSAPTASCTSPSATTRTAPTRQTLTNLLGKMLPHQHRRHDPDRQPVLHARPPARTARSGRSGCATRSRSRSSRAPAGCSSTTSARTRGRRSTTASPARTTAGPTPRGRRATRGFRSPVYSYARHDRDDGLRDHRRRVLQPADDAVPAELRRRLLLRRLRRDWIRKLDPGDRATRSSTSPPAIAAPVDLDVGRRRQPVLPRARRRARSIAIALHRQPRPDASRRSRRARRCPSASRPRSPSRPPAPRRSPTSGSATAIDIPARLGAATRSPRAQPSDNGAHFRVVVTNAVGTGTSNAAHADRDRRTSRRPRRSPRRRPARSTAAGRRSPSPAPPPTPRTARSAASRVHLAGRLPPRRRTRTRSCRRRAASTQRHVHDPDDRRDRQPNVWYRIHLTVTDSGGLTSHRLPRHPPAPRHAHAGDQPAGLQVTLDGQPFTAPHTFTSVVGFQRPLGRRRRRPSAARPTPSPRGPTAARARTRSPRRLPTRPTRRPTAAATAPFAAGSTSRRRPRRASPATWSTPARSSATAATATATAGTPTTRPRRATATPPTRPTSATTRSTTCRNSEPQRRLGDRRPQRHLPVRVVSGDPSHRQRLPDQRRGRAGRQRHARPPHALDRQNRHGHGDRRPADRQQRHGRANNKINFIEIAAA